MGEVAISGPQVMQGYWENASADADALIAIDGAQSLRTGDLAYADPDGNIHIVDRLKRMINASGYKVWPAEVEARLNRRHGGGQERSGGFQCHHLLTEGTQRGAKYGAVSMRIAGGLGAAGLFETFEGRAGDT